MANVPTEDEVKKIQEKAAKEEQRKIASQKKQGKDFVNHGQGVIPEKVWQNLPGKKEAK